MNILDNYRNNKNNTDNHESDICNLYSEKRYDEVISMYSLFINDKQDISLLIKQKAALSYYYKNEYEKSLPIFEEIAIKKNDIEHDIEDYR